MSKALSNISYSSASAKLTKLTSTQWIGIHARTSGFIQRRGNLNPVKFVTALLTAVGTPQKRDTIQALVSEYNYVATKGEQICYKPLHNRLRSDGCLRFMSELVGHLQERVINTAHRAEFEKVLRRLKNNGLMVDDFYLHDGTYWKINETFAEQYPACRYAKQAEIVEDTYELDGTAVMKEAKFAQIGLQTTYSMKAGTVTKLYVTSACANETEYVQHACNQHVLHLMDAGYSSFSLLEEINEYGDYFITKLKSNCAAIIENACLNGLDVTNEFKGMKLSCKEFRCFREREKVDLLVRLSDGNRYRVVRFYSKKEKMVRHFITNIFSRKITAKMLCAIYKIRWQIELLFKDLKSGSNLTGVNTRVENVMLVMLLASLAAFFLKQLAAGVVSATGNASLYRLSVYSATWLRGYLKALFRGDLLVVKQIIKKLVYAKDCFYQVRQSHFKHEAMKTIISVYSYLFSSLKQQGAKANSLSA